MMNKKISIVLPIFNESKNINKLYEMLSSILQNLSNHYIFEIIMVDDGSKDDSWQKIIELAHHDQSIKAIKFSRNFGHQLALIAGYNAASGDAVITMDSDLQHPPELIPAMIKAWHDGAKIVYVRNYERKDRFLKRITAYLFYFILDSISSVKIPRNVQDFRLIDRDVVEILKQSQEKNGYLRGMVAWSGYSYVVIPCIYPKRTRGQSAYTWSKMFKLAFDGMASFSTMPLKLACYIGFFVIFTGIFMFTYITWDAIINKIYYPLFKWLVTIIYIFMGVLFILLWFIGEYIGRIYDEVKKRPLYVIADSYNVKSD